MTREYWLVPRVVRREARSGERIRKETIAPTAGVIPASQRAILTRSEKLTNKGDKQTAVALRLIGNILLDFSESENYSEQMIQIGNALVKVGKSLKGLDGQQCNRVLSTLHVLYSNK